MFYLHSQLLSVASVGKTYIVYTIYMYATQQDAPHRNKLKYLLISLCIMIVLKFNL
jgi:hypothetical protein